MARSRPDIGLLDRIKNRILTREDLSRTLAAYCAFASAGKILDGDDKATLAHLHSNTKIVQR